MDKAVRIGVLLAVVCSTPFTEAQEQNTLPAGDRPRFPRVIVSSQASSDSAITIPPATSFSIDLKNNKYSEGPDGLDFETWIKNASALNGLESPNIRPWHIVIHYEKYDEDGDNDDSGTFEEFWAAPDKYKRIYKSESFNQTDYATSKGLFRLGNRQWPKLVQLEVRSEVVAPFLYAASLHGFHARKWNRTFSGQNLQCVVLEQNSGISDPTQYCFQPNTSVLRYTRGEFWHQIVYNDIETFQGRSIAREVDVTDGGKRYLELRVEKLEAIANLLDSDFLPAPGATGPLGDRISGVRLRPLKTVNPEWPGSSAGKRIEVSVEIVIGKDGSVIAAHAVSGPPEYFKICEKAARKWTFPVYRVIDKPVEVEQEVSFGHF
ncbi:MAG TPA: hypothetical protein VKT53_05780 [Candidatus Acidoferrum sp.]|nr:hypothetical protein [Candidatus Acidoferrum sp.]